MTEQTQTPVSASPPIQMSAWSSLEAMQQIAVMRKKDPEVAKVILDRTERMFRHHIRLDWFNQGVRLLSLVVMAGLGAFSWQLMLRSAYGQALGVFIAGSVAVSAVASGRSIVQVFIRAPKSKE
jgi:hypothetical protein